MEKTPVSRLTEDIRESAENRESWFSGAKSHFMWAAVIGGATTWTAATVKPSAFILGIQAGYALYEAGGGVIDLARARDAGRRVIAMREVLTQHELTTGEVVKVYPDTEEEQSQSETAPLYDHEHPAKA